MCAYKGSPCRHEKLFSMQKVFVGFLVVFLFFLRCQFLSKLDLKDGQKVRITGALTEEPQISGNQQKLKLGRFEVWVKKYPEYHYGERIEVVGKVKVKPIFALVLPQISFNYPLISFSRYQVEVESMTSFASTTSITGIKGTAIGLRRRILDIYKRIFPQTLDGIVAGIVLGDKSLIGEDFWQELQQTGTLHIMVASGMNIAMFSQGLLSFFLLFFRRRLAIYCLIIVIWFYSIMTGLAPPMVRAACMASLIYLGSIFGKETEGGRILFLTGLLMIFGNPVLIFDIGFQLSFMATAGLVYLQPRLKNAGGLSLTKRIMKLDNFSSSLASLMATLPILLLNFGQLNLLSPFINLIILWTIPFILQIGIVIGILGLVWIKLAELTSYLLYPLLFFLEQTITFFAKITFSQVEVFKFGWWWLAVYYFILWLWLRKGKQNV